MLINALFSVIFLIHYRGWWIREKHNCKTNEVSMNHMYMYHDWRVAIITFFLNQIRIMKGYGILEIHVLWISKIFLCCIWLSWIVEFKSEPYNDVYVWQKDVNACIVLPGACVEVWTPTRTFTCLYFITNLICTFFCSMFYLSKFHTEKDFVFKYHILQFYLQF